MPGLSGGRRRSRTGGVRSGGRDGDGRIVVSQSKVGFHIGLGDSFRRASGLPGYGVWQGRVGTYGKGRSMDRTLGIIAGIAVAALALSVAPLEAQTPEREETPPPAPAPAPTPAPAPAPPPPPPPAPAPSAPPPAPPSSAPAPAPGAPERPQLRRRPSTSGLEPGPDPSEAFASLWSAESTPRSAVPLAWRLSPAPVATVL